MMNDCWPSSAGWSLIDFYNVPKIAYYAFKRCAKRVIASVDRENGRYRVYLVNDGEVTDAAVSIKVISSDRRTVRVSAKGKYIHAVMITGDAVFEDNGFSLLPYETRTVAYKQIGDRAHGVLSVEAYTLCCPSCPLLTTDAGCAII